MRTTASCAVPTALRIDAALRDNGVLRSLRDRVQASDGRLAAVRGHLPGQLGAHVRAGPLDDDAWSLIAANASVAAKLRQLTPRLEQALVDAGWPARHIRIKIEGAT